MAGITLRCGDYETTFRPDLAMLCTSLRYAGDEFVGLPRTLAEFKAGGATGMPLVHPWINRLGRWRYESAGRSVSLSGTVLPIDGNGLPIHGNLFAIPFDVEHESPARIVASLDYGAHPDRLVAFPFPHMVTIDVRLDADRGLTIGTEVRPTGDAPVPISFGWHPYLRLPHDSRHSWELRWPACEHVEVDERTIPTGARTAQPAESAPIGGRTFDDHYALGDDRNFAVSTSDRALTLRFDTAYAFAQLYVPARRRLLAIEPMTAEIDALGRGTAPLCQPGESFRAEFMIDVSR
ncbi:MAG TPA: aldose 1-epimerase [Acidimicrobiia bacterium]|nr:aldose 1-epimerase [Acidimicrobiia bacterium]